MVYEYETNFKPSSALWRLVSGFLPVTPTVYGLHHLSFGFLKVNFVCISSGVSDDNAMNCEASINASLHARSLSAWAAEPRASTNRTGHCEPVSVAALPSYYSVNLQLLYIIDLVKNSILMRLLRVGKILIT